LLVESVELEELGLLGVVVVGPDHDDDKDGQKDSEAFNPSYKFKL